MKLAPSILDYITLGIAVWGALLSTILAIKVFKKINVEFMLHVAYVSF
jgi:hypothetical protein